MSTTNIEMPKPGEAARAVASYVQSRTEYVGLFTALLGLCALFAVLSPYFLTHANLLAIGVAVSITAVLAAAQTVVLVSGSIDLSFAAILALAGITAQRVQEAGAPLTVVIAAAFAVGTACGLLNAAIVVGVGVNALIATIGTNFVFRGVCFLWLAGESLPYFEDTSLNYFADGRILGVPFPIALSVVTIGGVWLLMRVTRFGHRVKAVGGNEAAARLVGVPVARLRTLIFAMSGACAAVGGIMLTSLNGTAFPDAATGDELKVIAAVILGGTALTGGRGSVLGTTIGVLLLGVLANGLNLLGVDAYWQVLLSGVALIVAVVIDETRKRAEQR
jgi:ribose/xylose/arabinose/galactoside ABC-type transport system permease subunit